MQLHRATTVYEPIAPNIFSSCRRKPCAVYGDGEAHSLSVSADRDVLLARIEIAEAYYRGGDSLALDMLASSSLRLYGHVIAVSLCFGHHRYLDRYEKRGRPQRTAFFSTGC
jgi:hypothetical protein